MTDWVAPVGTVAGIIISSLVALAIAKTNTRATNQSAITAPYDKLAQRVTDLETADETKSREIGRLRDHLTVVISDRDALVAYVKQLWEWTARGAKPPPPPVPSHLRDLLDPDDWEVAHITEHTTTTTYVMPPAEPGT